MKKNVGNTDKLIRLIIAVVLFLLVYTGKVASETWQYIFLVVAFIAALTSLINYCPLYPIFGIDTTKKRNNP
jgi:hypothetical protein